MTGGEATGGAPYVRRRAGFRERIEEELDGFLVRHPPNVRYLSGFTGSSGCLLFLPGSTTLITDGRYEEQAADEVVGDVALRVSHDGLLDVLGELLDGERRSEGAEAPAVGFEADRVTVAARDRLERECPGASWRPIGGCVEEMRVRKEPEEVERIRRAVEVTLAALDEVLGRIDEGVTEREVVAELEYLLRRRGSDAPAFETIVAGGPRSARPHARAGESELREGDLVLLDVGATVEGYCADVTRTVCLGAAREWQREIHSAVGDARRAAIAQVAPGRSAGDPDRAVRACLEERGLADRLGHSTGHGIGLEVHEAPRVHRDSEDILREGYVVTIEPGVYLPGRGGVRIEDDVLVSTDGPRVLSEFDRDLREL